MLKKIRKILFYVLSIYTILGFLVFPLTLKYELIKLISQETNSKLSIDKIYFNPYTFVLKISDVKLKSLDDKPLASIELIGMNLEPYSLFNAALHVKNFLLEKPQISIVYNKDETINLLSILKPSKSEQKSSDDKPVKIPRIILDKVSIFNGHVDYEDHTHKNRFDFAFNDIGFELKNVDTNDLNSSNASLKFYTHLSDGGFVDLRSSLVGFKPFIVKGSLGFESAKLYTEWRYLQDYLNIEIADGKLSAHSDYYVNLDDLDSTLLSNIDIYLNNLRIKPKSAPKDILSFNSFSVKGASVKPMLSDVHIKNITLDSLNAKVQKTKKAEIDWLDYIKTNFDSKNNSKEKQNALNDKENPKPWSVGIDKIALKDLDVSFKDNTKMAKNALSKLNDFDLVIPNISLENFKIRSKEPDEDEDFRATLDKFALNSGRLTFKDEALPGSAKTTIDNIELSASDIDSKKTSWLKYDASLRINKKGYIKSDGKLSHAPLEQEGTFKVDRVSLKEITPYIQRSAFISIDDGYLDIDTKTKYAPSKKRADLNVKGYADIRNFFLSDSRNKTSLVSFNKLALNGLNLSLMPNRAYVNRVDLNSFYVNAIVNKDKSMNLSSLAKKSNAQSKSVKKSKKSSKDDFVVKINRIKVKDGSAKFADLSLPILFKTDIHDLNGEIRSISNTKGKNSYVDITGEVDKYGSTKLKGNINSSNPKAYTDLDLNFKNLELSSLSGYSASFAGYKIDNGKLYLDLGYNILNSKLKSTNSVVIKKIELGDTIEDENVTTLPLGFVIGLLEDDEGVIDIDLPIEGNIDEPDFKYGALVWKTLGNLITKAVTSPFNFLGSMLGLDGDKLEAIEFEPGLPVITPPEKEKLDSIVKIMKKRPKLLLAISAKYDEKTDKYAIAKAKTDTMIMKENDEENEKKVNITIDVLEDIYEKLKDDDGLEKIEDALDEKYSGDEFDAAYLKAAYEACISAQTITKKELEELARKRADNLVSYLDVNGGIDPKRIIKNDISNTDESLDDVVKTKLQIEVK